MISRSPGARRLLAGARSLRGRFAAAFALVAAVVALAVGILSYDAAAERIGGEIDSSLRSAASAVLAGQLDVLSAATPGDHGHHGPPAYLLVAQLVATDGTTTRLGGGTGALPVTAGAASVAASGSTGAVDVSEADVGDDTYRILTIGLGTGRGAVQVGTDVSPTHAVLHGMAFQIALIGAAILAVAAAAGWLLAGRITRRLMRLASTAEEISLHSGVDRAVPVEGRDEVARLSASFNTMLGRLAGARQAQERLIQDAAHELRTPLTSLRTNASVLRRIEELPPAARAGLVADVQSETRELSHLVDELVELALAGVGDDPETRVELGDLVRAAAARTERRTGRIVNVTADDTAVRGHRAGLDRAVGNLLENATKFDTSAGPVDVTVAGGRISVGDRGPGIGEDDLARVFDRFFRADTARAAPGSGLGLAIVRDVAEAHGGEVFAGPRPGGGALVGLTVPDERLLPTSEPDIACDSPGTDSLSPTTAAPAVRATSAIPAGRPPDLDERST